MSYRCQVLLSHFQYSDTDSLKAKQWKKVYHSNPKENYTTISYCRFQNKESYQHERGILHNPMRKTS